MASKYRNLTVGGASLSKVRGILNAWPTIGLPVTDSNVNLCTVQQQFVFECITQRIIEYNIVSNIVGRTNKLCYCIIY